jgi:hypothetical protein
LRGMRFDRLGAHDDLNDDVAPDGKHGEPCAPILGGCVHVVAGSVSVRAAEP